MPRLLRRILLFTGAFLLLCVSTLILLAYIYQDDVKSKLIAELNEHLKVPVQQSGIELTLIKRFPQASLRFREVFVREVRSDSLPPDTLLYAKDLYLEFGLFALLRGDYTVSRAHGEDVRVNAGLDRHGAENWAIWKNDSTPGGSSDLDLRKVTFDGLSARYHDDRTRLLVRTGSKQLALRGRFREEGSRLEVLGDIHLERWSDAGGTQLSDRQADVKLQLAFGGNDGAFRIEKGSELLTGETPISVTMALEKGAKGRMLDLRANGFNLALGDVVALLPEKLNHRLRHYALNGEADVAVHYRGPLYGEGPALSAGMNVRDGRLKEATTGAAFKAVRGEFAIDLTAKGAPSKITVKGFSAQAASGTISGAFELAGVKDARVKADVQGDIALADLFRFVRLDTLEQVEGRLNANAHVLGKLRDAGSIKAADLRALIVNGTLRLRDATLKMRGVRHRITELNAELALNGNDADVHGLRCNVQGNAIELSGTLRNLMPYLLFPEQRLTISAKGRSPELDLASLFSTTEGASSGTPSRDYVVVLPALIDLDLRAQVDELVFEDFAAHDIQGTIQLQNQVLHVRPLSFTSAQGAVTGTLELDGRVPTAYPLTIAATVSHINIGDLFHEFRNFGQTFITDHHLKGRSDVRLTLNADLTPSLGLDQNSLRCVAGLVIENGELNEHAPMIAVADYLRKNKLVSPFVDTEELKRRLTHVTFARLENQIEIKDRTVFVPTMLVKSSAMDLEVSAAQTFDGGVDDHINFRLGDLFKLGAVTDDEFGPVADDGTGLRIFLRMFGTTENLQFGNDGAMASARRKEKMKQETAELKGILGDIWHGRSAQTEPPALATPSFSVDTGGRDSTRTAAAAPRKKTGLGRLLEKHGKGDDEQETITVE